MGEGREREEGGKRGGKREGRGREEGREEGEGEGRGREEEGADWRWEEGGGRECISIPDRKASS